MNFYQVYLVLIARRRLAIAVFVGVIVLVCCLALLMGKRYTATASLVVDAKVDPVQGGVNTDNFMAGYLATQIDVIGSERVALRAVKALKLSDDPKYREMWEEKTEGKGDIDRWLATYLLKLKVVRIQAAHESLTHPSNVIEILVKWPDPKMAADIANAFAQAAIDTNIELKIEPAKQYAAWFADRSRALRQNLEAKQKALSDFQNLNGIVATDEKLDVETARLTELSTELVNIQGERQDSQSRQRQVTGDNDSLPEVMQSPLIAALKNSLSDAEAKRADIAGTLGKNHPDYQAADAEVTALRTKLTEETNKIAASLGSTTRVNVRRENDIKEALEAQKKKVLELKHQHDKAAVLESDVQTAQRDLDAVTQRFAESSLESQTHQTNLVQLTTAVEPVEPSSPKWLLVLIVGMFVGAVGGVLAALVIEFKNPLVRHESEFEMLLGLPLLAKVPTMKSTGAGNASISSGLLEAPGT